MLGIIGGTGFYKLEGLEVIEEIDADTPFGKPSAPLARVRYADKEVIFLPRHGARHQFLPHEVNYRANIYALKQAGIRQIVGFSAIGSLREDIAPGEFAIPEQYIDWVKDGRVKTFFGSGIAAHVSTAKPVCSNLTQALADAAQRINTKLHTGKTYICVDGPRLGTQAESHFFRQIGGDLVGMTNVPEVFLAREAQICYATVGIATDYDCWKEDPADHADTATIIARYGASLVKANAMLKSFLEAPLPKADPLIRENLRGAIMTPDETLSTQALDMLTVLRA
ncbi:MAG: methylthioadenosine phosphorylase [Alphaproteobacteria bacterium CG1_02_46_17]|nr:MAG: methylthioadenosine phosphorylase [Alphaproteobacteria bacterium CG1_02_46_17]